MSRAARLAVAVGFVVLLILAVAALEEPPRENREAVTAATMAAAREYGRVMEVIGDRDAAQWASDQVFGEVLAQWD